jgi:polar amino acid transport system substrate-binding protein
MTTEAIDGHTKAELAPHGKIRIGLNYQNFLLVLKDTPDGQPTGIAPDLGRELAKRAGLQIEFVRFAGAGDLADAVKSAAWDVAFLGNEPARASEIAFSAAYLEIPVTFLVPPGSPIRTIGQIDAKGVRIAVSEKSAYDLYLSRTIKHATIMRTKGIEASFKLFLDQKLEALGGLKPRLVADGDELPGSRVLEGQVTAVQQSVGVPKARQKAAAFVRKFVEDVKASGLVGRTIEKHKVRGVTVAPKG